MFEITDGKAVWRGGKEDYEKAADTAAACSAFRADCEEECVADEEASCYNCRYRRWTRESFVCMKGGNV